MQKVQKYKYSKYKITYTLKFIIQNDADNNSTEPQVIKYLTVLFRVSCFYVQLCFLLNAHFWLLVILKCPSCDQGTGHLAFLPSQAFLIQRRKKRDKKCWKHTLASKNCWIVAASDISWNHCWKHILEKNWHQEALCWISTVHK